MGVLEAADVMQNLGCRVKASFLTQAYLVFKEVQLRITADAITARLPVVVLILQALALELQMVKLLLHLLTGQLVVIPLFLQSSCLHNNRMSCHLYAIAH